jgi:hypothetical protein
MTAAPGAPGTWDREMWWALNAVTLPGMARAGRHRWRLVAPITHRGFRITVAAVRHPYGRSTHASAYLSHILAGVLLVWRSGVLRGAQARWRCGARTIHFRLLDEPDSVICPACKIDRTGDTR